MIDPTPCERPHRSDYASEPAYLLACFAYLDATCPTRVERMREWRALAMSSDRARIRDRLVELIDIDGPLTRDEWREYCNLVEAWKRLRDARITAKKESTS